MNTLKKDKCQKDYRPKNKYRLPTPGPASGAQREAAGYQIAKRLLDMAGAAFLLALSFPLMLTIGVLIKATSPGPILFRQVRLGRNGSKFWVLKFRTMARDAEQQLASHPDLLQTFEVSFKIVNDPRITPVGAFLRKTSLDELPQMLNVLEGSMSLIGPRPIVPGELKKYGAYGQKLLTVKPGLGGLWQVSGRSDTTYEERVALDMRYVDHHSLPLDLWLLLRTAASVLTCRGSV